METDRDELLGELKRVLGAMVDSGTASMKPEALRAMQAALASGRARIGFLIEFSPPLGIDCLLMTGQKLIPLFAIRTGGAAGAMN